MADRRIVLGGLDASTGRLLIPPVTVARFAARIKEKIGRREPRAVKYGVRADDLESAGWGVVVAEDADPEVLGAIGPLLEHRQAQATARNERLFRLLTYERGKSALSFRSDHGAGPGPVDPERLPLYLLLVGSPEAIPFPVQYDLGVQHAVGRIAMDSAAAYHRYARGVVEAETECARRPARALLFGVENPDDSITASCVRHLMRPLATALGKRSRAATAPWQVEHVLGPAATKAELERSLRAASRPSLLMTAGHAVGFPLGHARQKSDQGALVCSDWPGRRQWRAAIPETFYFGANDVAPDLDLSGMVLFPFACYSAGTPSIDSFADQGTMRRIAPADFVAALPKRLLGQPAGSALAVIGHVDRAWEQSFTWTNDERETSGQPAVFESALAALLDGQPVGLAASSFGQRYAELAVHLATVDSTAAGAETETDSAPQDLATVRLWSAFQDARTMIVLGDPAVRLAR